MYHNNFFTDEQWECIRVCVANAPIPYDITKKKIPADILAKIGQPKRIKQEGIPIVKYDLTPYGIFNDELHRIRSGILDSTSTLSFNKVGSI